MTTAATITHSSSAMPTAVMTESREKTMSSSMICPMTAANDGATLAETCPSSPSSLSWISCVALASRNRPPPSRMRSRPEISCPSTVKSGAVRRTIHASENSSRMRMQHRGQQADRARAVLLIGGQLARRGSR